MIAVRPGTLVPAIPESGCLATGVSGSSASMHPVSLPSRCLRTRTLQGLALTLLLILGTACGERTSNTRDDTPARSSDASADSSPTDRGASDPGASDRGAANRGAADRVEDGPSIQADTRTGGGEEAATRGPDLESTLEALAGLTQWLSGHRSHPTERGLDEFRSYALEVRAWYVLYLF